jgi:hypothetical protein
VRTDVERGLLLVEGAVPGSKGGMILVRDAVKHPLPKEAPKPGKFREPTEYTPEPEKKAKPKAEAKSEPKAEPKSEAKAAEAKPAAKAEPKPKEKAKAKPKSGGKK